MKILSIDTSSEICSCSILEDSKIIKEISNNEGLTHSVMLMPQVEQLLKESNLTLNDIDLFVCDKGPGSFTGIRIGISTVKAFTDVYKKQALGISSLRALAYNEKNDGYICSLIDARNNNVYYGLFKKENNIYTQIDEYLADSISNITNILKKYDKKITFVGNGGIVYKDVIESTLKENAIFSNNNNLYSSKIGQAAYDIYSSNNISEPFNLNPMYLKKSSAEQLLENKKEF